MNTCVRDARASTTYCVYVCVLYQLLKTVIQQYEHHRHHHDHHRVESRKCGKSFKIPLLNII